MWTLGKSRIASNLQASNEFPFLTILLQLSLGIYSVKLLVFWRREFYIDLHCNPDSFIDLSYIFDSDRQPIVNFHRIPHHSPHKLRQQKNRGRNVEIRFQANLNDKACRWIEFSRLNFYAQRYEPCIIGKIALCASHPFVFNWSSLLMLGLIYHKPIHQKFNSVKKVSISKAFAFPDFKPWDALWAIYPKYFPETF